LPAVLTFFPLDFVTYFLQELGLRIVNKVLRRVHVHGQHVVIVHVWYVIRLHVSIINIFNVPVSIVW
jgi:hypothetical protein